MRLPLSTSEQPIVFHFDVERLEPILEVNRRVHALLAAKNHRVTYLETEAGHDWTSWRDRLAAGHPCNLE
jgi:enterochelin esterase-like enzyme